MDPGWVGESLGGYMVTRGSGCDQLRANQGHYGANMTWKNGSTEVPKHAALRMSTLVLDERVDLGLVVGPIFFACECDYSSVVRVPFPYFLDIPECSGLQLEVNTISYLPTN